MNEFIVIPDLFKKITDRVNETFSMRPIDPFPVRFEYGHIAEVTRKLTLLDNGITQKDKKFPLIWLVMDFVESIDSRQIGYCTLPDLNILIATSTNIDGYTSDRIDNTFRPVLIPVYQELIKQIADSGFFYEQSADYIPHKRILRPYWGGQENGNSTQNIFNDYIDAIQIKGLSLTVNENVCNVFDL